MNLNSLPPKYRAQAASQLEDAPAATKYHNRKCVVDGMKFDSQAEAARYGELVMLQQAGLISDLRRQVRFCVVDKYIDAWGRKWKPVDYIVDFVYVESGLQVAEDVKGMRTADYVIKSKLFQQRYPHIKFLEVKG